MAGELAPDFTQVLAGEGKATEQEVACDKEERGDGPVEPAFMPDPDPPLGIIFSYLLSRTFSISFGKLGLPLSFKAVPIILPFKINLSSGYL